MNIPSLLILDDDQSTNLVTRFLLDHLAISNYHFETNGWNTLSFLEQCQQQQCFPNIIFVDIKMPIMDGFEFIEQYQHKFWASFPQTQVFVVSSTISERDKDQAKAFSCVSRFIQKPLTEEKLQAIFNGKIPV